MTKIPAAILKSKKVHRFAKFCLVGGSGVFVDMGVLYLLADPKTLGWSITLSKLIAVEVAILNNFLWNDTWTFGDVSASQTGIKAKISRFGKFNLVCMAGMLFNVILLNLQVHVLELNLYLANFIAIVLVTGWNFWVNYKFSWKAMDGKG